ncbi:hypothetical protein HK096_002461 [Nowakowskiella sp. JEL0078]|nr:hypothetical protein HK096_002461 [Nowakowskiella sp. JEL0078]
MLGCCSPFANEQKKEHQVPLSASPRPSMSVPTTLPIASTDASPSTASNAISKPLTTNPALTTDLNVGSHVLDEKPLGHALVDNVRVPTVTADPSISEPTVLTDPNADTTTTLQNFRMRLLHKTGTGLQIRPVSSCVKGNDAPYEIISHVWGMDPKRLVAPPSLDGCTWKIPIFSQSKLDCVIGWLSDRDSGSPVWIDVLCMNQDDQREVNGQVASFPTYYKDAAACHVLLDSTSPDGKDECCDGNRLSSWAEELQNLTARINTDHVACMKRIGELHKRWSGIITPDWFQRVWTLQEAILPKSIHFHRMCPKHATYHSIGEWPDLVKIIGTHRVVADWTVQNPGSVLSVGLESAQLMGKVGKMDDDVRSVEVIRQLYHDYDGGSFPHKDGVFATHDGIKLIISCLRKQSRQTSRQHDYVYGILGIFPTFADFVVDYEQPFGKLLESLYRHINLRFGFAFSGIGKQVMESGLGWLQINADCESMAEAWAGSDLRQHQYAQGIATEAGSKRRDDFVAIMGADYDVTALAHIERTKGYDMKMTVFQLDAARHIVKVLDESRSISLALPSLLRDFGNEVSDVNISWGMVWAGMFEEMHMFVSDIGIPVPDILTFAIVVINQFLPHSENSQLAMAGAKLYWNVWRWLKARHNLPETEDNRTLCPRWLSHGDASIQLAPGIFSPNSFLFTSLLLHVIRSKQPLYFLLDAPTSMMHMHLPVETEMVVMLASQPHIGIGPVGLHSVLGAVLLHYVICPVDHNDAGLMLIPQTLCMLSLVRCKHGDKQPVPALVMTDNVFESGKYWITSGVAGCGRICKYKDMTRKDVLGGHLLIRQAVGGIYMQKQEMNEIMLMLGYVG